MREIYRPLQRWYFAVFALYYAVMLPGHADFYVGTQRIVMLALAGAAFLIALAGFFVFRRRLGMKMAEAFIFALNALVVLNVLVALNIEFKSVKLVYFVIIAIAFSMASVSFRQSLASIAIAAAAYLSFMPRLDAATFTTFGFLSVGAAIASMSIAILMRRALMAIANAKIEAEDQLANARELESTLRQQSLSDELTGLPNRRAFFRQLEAIVPDPSGHSPEAPALHHWLILLDLDGFKAVNDIHGHFIGDRLLEEVARRIKAVCGADMHVSRMGGDEFNMILTVREDVRESGDGGPCTAHERCQALLAAVSQPYVIEGRHIRISATVGYKRVEPEETIERQLTQADYALITAKKRGKNCALEFTSDLAQASDEREIIEQAMRQADLESELDLVFQPQFDFTAERIVAVEALARWDSPIVGRIPPDQFIRIAEESGLITGITMTVVEKAFRTASQWDGSLRLAINLSSYDLINDPNIDHIIALSSELGVNPANVEFEVTETAMMVDFDKATANLARLSGHGFGLALDDFGTGYSNFSYLRRLPITKLKVDRSFLENPGEEMTERMLASLAGMARLLGVHCLLEGIEDEIGLLMAKRVGAQSVQGYLFGAPMSEAELTRHIARSGLENADGAERAGVVLRSRDRR